ncbi:hypothetical protein MTR_4g045913 [Medicago truncatula]|uniref:Transmembrane protein n=1 Tax=Medicago truncatula TaxID=3880 RepID=A0A072UIK2_MEDTR|nr:hypothetical protein MTR_4g045913 [Medicago truncatula]
MLNLTLFHLWVILKITAPLHRDSTVRPYIITKQGLELGIREIDGGELLVIEEKDEMGLLVIGFGIGYRRN